MAQRQQPPMGQGGQQYGGQQGTQQYGGTQGSQQHGGGQQQYGGGQQGQFGQGTGTSQGIGGQGRGQAFDDYLTGDERLVLHDVVKATHTAAWCADLCIDEGPQMATCIRLCEDIEELGGVTQEFIARESIFVPNLLETLAEAAHECAMECEQHGSPHCQENASVLHKLVESTTELLQKKFGGGQGIGGGQQQGFDQGGQQPQSGGQQPRMGGGQQPRMGGGQQPQSDGQSGRQSGGSRLRGRSRTSGPQSGGTDAPTGGQQY